QMHTKQVQTMILAPRMIQSMEILQLPIMALQERIQQELQENPVLELKETPPDDLPNGEFDDFSTDSSEPERKDVADPRSELVINMLTHLDEKGYLSTPLEEIARGWPEPVEAAQLEEALHLLQKLDPPGVGARSLEECLLLQLTPETPHRDVLRALIEHHLDDIQHNRLPIIQRRAGFELTVIKAAIEVLKHLNPRPGSQFTADNIPYVVPDIVVERREDGDYDVRLLDDWVPNIYISRRYMELYRDKGADPKAKEYLKRKIQAAQWLLESIEQRRSTVEK